MKFYIRSSEFYDFIEMYLNNKSTLSLSVHDNNIKLQIAKSAIIQTELSVRVEQRSEFNSAAFIVERYLLSLDRLGADVCFMISESVITIMQGSTMFTFPKTYDVSNDYGNLDKLEWHDFNVGKLKYITNTINKCNPITKELGINVPDVAFYYNHVYAEYQQMILIESLEFPNCSIPFNTLRAFAFTLTDNAQYSIVETKDLLCIKNGNYYIYINLATQNISIPFLNAINKKVTGLSDITTVSLENHLSKLDIVTASFPKTKVNLCIGDGQCSIALNSAMVMHEVGDILNSVIASADITTGQLKAITKLFSKDDISVMGGDNCICLKVQQTILMIATLIHYQKRY